MIGDKCQWIPLCNRQASATVFDPTHGRIPVCELCKFCAELAPLLYPPEDIEEPL